MVVIRIAQPYNQKGGEYMFDNKPKYLKDGSNGQPSHGGEDAETKNSTRTDGPPDEHTSMHGGRDK